jgi:TonB family protein
MDDRRIKATRGAQAGRISATANDRLKRRWNSWLSASMVAGGALHAAVFMFTPGVQVARLTPDDSAPSQLLVVRAFSQPDLPPPVNDIDLIFPALPTIAELALDLDIETTIPIPDFADLSILSKVPVPTLETAHNEWLDYQHFAPLVVRPEIRNRSELKRFLERNYQPILEFSGATGIVQISFWIDEAGLVEKAEIAKSSGSRSLDRLAMRLTRVLRFRPAILAGRPVKIQVRMPITFRAA